MKSDITVAVITGGHSFDIPNFHVLIRGLSGVDCYIQHLEDFVSDAGKVRDTYDVLLFYMMPQPYPPAENEKGWERGIIPALKTLGTTRQGIFFLHHAILAYWDWGFLSSIVGIRNRHVDETHDDLSMLVEVVDPFHPITAGLTQWEIVDEGYVMDEPDAEGNVVLLRVDHPKSMRAIAWTRQFLCSRVFCLELGHDRAAWMNPNFKLVVERGIHWCAGAH